MHKRRASHSCTEFKQMDNGANPENSWTKKIKKFCNLGNFLHLTWPKIPELQFDWHPLVHIMQDFPSLQNNKALFLYADYKKPYYCNLDALVFSNMNSVYHVIEKIFAKKQHWKSLRWCSKQHSKCSIVIYFIRSKETHWEMCTWMNCYSFDNKTKCFQHAVWQFNKLINVRIILTKWQMG